MSPAWAASASRCRPTRCASTATSRAPSPSRRRCARCSRRKESRLPHPKLFEPIQLGGITLPNRVVISPMCQYSADDGSMTDWHLAHLGSMACSGAGLFVVEKTNVTREGRITHGCTGLYNDHNEAAMARAVQIYRGITRNPIGIQIGHAGRKASSQVPWQGGKALGPAESPWPTVVPSPIAVAYAGELKRIGLDFICVSSGATVPQARIPVAPGFQVGFADKVRKEAGISTRAVGMIAGAEQAEEILASGKADMAAMARAILDNPRWAWHAAKRFGV